jgi:hypothetical protein
LEPPAAAGGFFIKERIVKNLRINPLLFQLFTIVLMQFN